VSNSGISTILGLIRIRINGSRQMAFYAILFNQNNRRDTA
jgi:hypothetical protein